MVHAHFLIGNVFVAGQLDAVHAQVGLHDVAAAGRQSQHLGQEVTKRRRPSADFTCGGWHRRTPVQYGAPETAAHRQGGNSDKRPKVAERVFKKLGSAFQLRSPSALSSRYVERIRSLKSTVNIGCGGKGLPFNPLEGTELVPAPHGRAAGSRISRPGRLHFYSYQFAVLLQVADGIHQAVVGPWCLYECVSV